jgi:hypothetical protein
MPYKAEKPCRYPGCIHTTSRKYCAEHEAAARKEYNESRRDIWKTYDYRWRKLSALYLSKHPLCEECHKAGKLMMELSERYCDVILKRIIDYRKTDEGIYLLRDGKQMMCHEVNVEDELPL